MNYTTWLNSVLDRIQGLDLDARVTGINFRQLYNRGLSIQEAVKLAIEGSAN